MNQFSMYKSEVQSATKNKVLRNTYMLLALTMIPTIIGAFIGLELGIASFAASNPIIFFVGFLAVSIGMITLVAKNSNSSAGVFWLLLFTLFEGALLSVMLASVLKMANGSEIIMLAAGGTGALFVTMSALATVIKKDLSGMYKFLITGVVLLIVAGLANIFFQLPVLSLAISYIAMMVFSIFLLIDTQRIVNGGETNYIRATLSIYINLFNIFTSLLNILRS
ncbi:TPA: Bax inhibitor-1 family protein [Escherichia coli]|jgi:modulator of FtsH protease|nr:Bax inhibitor-1 family protein [Escherichia coli]